MKECTLSCIKCQTWLKQACMYPIGKRLSFQSDLLTEACVMMSHALAPSDMFRSSRRPQGEWSILSTCSICYIESVCTIGLDFEKWKGKAKVLSQTFNDIFKLVYEAECFHGGYYRNFLHVYSPLY